MAVRRFRCRRPLHHRQERSVDFARTTSRDKPFNINFLNLCVIDPAASTLIITYLIDVGRSKFFLVNNFAIHFAKNLRRLLFLSIRPLSDLHICSFINQ
ncbi:hypothetical protein PGB90_005990 [Kerria lacca]